MSDNPVVQNSERAATAACLNRTATNLSVSQNETPLQSRTPAIALTAFARSEDRTRALRAGFLAHVSKPVQPAELIATVASVSKRT